MKQQSRYRVVAQSLVWSVAAPGLATLSIGAPADGEGTRCPRHGQDRPCGPARPAYEPAVIQQGSRFILYVGRRQADMLNPLTGKVEPDGVSTVDVTNPACGRATFPPPRPRRRPVWDNPDPVHPRQIAHFIPPANANMRPNCATLNGKQVCRTDISTNNVELEHSSTSSIALAAARIFWR
jgi:hypothetical protein